MEELNTIYSSLYELSYEEDHIPLSLACQLHLYHHFLWLFASLYFKVEQVPANTLHKIAFSIPVGLHIPMVSKQHWRIYLYTNANYSGLWYTCYRYNDIGSRKKVGRRKIDDMLTKMTLQFVLS